MATIETIRQQDTARLRVEFALLYLAAPLAMALLLPPRLMFPMLFAVTLVGLILLGLTSGFRWRDLAQGRERIVPRLIWGIGALVIAFGTLLLWLTQPEALFQIARERPLLLLMILVLYPVLSALPQEIVYRVLFFRRYKPILPGNPRAQLFLNAGLFSLGHLMYWSALVLVMTFLGGLAFSWAYERRRSFPMAVLMHAMAGDAIFLVGLGVYFYSGNVVRPF